MKYMNSEIHEFLKLLTVGGWSRRRPRSIWQDIPLTFGL